jgi:hypothetical protein
MYAAKRAGRSNYQLFAIGTNPAAQHGPKEQGDLFHGADSRRHSGSEAPQAKRDLDESNHATCD